MPLSPPDPGRRARAATAVLVNVKVRQATRRMPRLARWLMRRNRLRRPVDRIEGAVLIALSAAFGSALVLAALLGTHAYQSGRAATAGLRPVTAQLVQNGPSGGGPVRVGTAAARWSVPGGGAHRGVLTTAIAPDIFGAPAGAPIPIWVTASGLPVVPPADQAVQVIYALTTGGVAAGGAALALVLTYTLCRLVLDRRRLAGWDSAWARTGPTWTSRR